LLNGKKNFLRGKNKTKVHPFFNYKGPLGHFQLSAELVGESL